MLCAVTFGILPSELRHRMTSTDFVSLAAYYRRNPWGPWRDDLRAAHTTAMLYNINRRSGSPSVPATDFIFDPDRAEKLEAENAKATLAMFDSLAAKSTGGNNDASK